jgi:hypothetical protein
VVTSGDTAGTEEHHSTGAVRVHPSPSPVAGREALEFWSVAAGADVKILGAVVLVFGSIGFVQKQFDSGVVIVGGDFGRRVGSRGFGYGGCLIGYGNGKLGCLPIVHNDQEVRTGPFSSLTVLILAWSTPRTNGRFES